MTNSELPNGWYPLDYSGNSIVCPMMNMVLPDDPRDIAGLLEYRKKLYIQCDRSRDSQRLAWQLSKRSFAWWCNAFVWTPSGMRFNASMKQVQQDLAMMPWRHWPINDAQDLVYEACVLEGRSAMFPKSRDMRATLYFILRYTHNLLFRRNWYGLMLAHKEDLVDGKSMEGLLPRVRRVLGHLPAWMTHDADGDRLWSSKHCLIHNRAANNMVAGAASTQEPATGERPTEVLFDEAAKNPNFSIAYDQTSAACKNRWVVSTYKGPERFALLDEEGIEVFPMLYYNHPNKGQGREFRINNNPQYPVKTGKRYVHTKWFDEDVWDRKKQAAIQHTTHVAQDILADKAAGSSGFFDGDVLLIGRQRAESVMPDVVGSIARKYEPSPERDAAIIKREDGLMRIVRDVGQSFKWWMPLQTNNRPSQDLTYAVFADISNGRGASNSVAAIGCVEYNNVVGMYAASEYEPSEFARQLVELCHWLGGRDKYPWLGWEVNGPGEGLDREFAKLNYPKLWAATDKELGWRSNGGAKEEAANKLSIAIQNDELPIPDPMFFREAEDWAYLTATTIGAKKLSKDPHATATHGDRVIAVMGLNLMLHTITKPRPKSGFTPGVMVFPDSGR